MTPSTAASTDAGALADALKAIIQMDDDARDANGKPEANLNGVGLVDLFDCVNHPFGSGEHKQQPYRSNQLEAALSDARTALVEYTRNSAPQETRGDEPVAWRWRFKRDGEEGRWIYNDDHPDLPTKEIEIRPLYAAPQQSPRLEREGIARIIDPGAWELKDIGYTLPKFAVEKSLSKADAILALLSPPGPMVPWELDCQRRICAAPECECPAVSSTEQVWQPADTAPQDGSTIEVRFLTDNPRRVRWSQSDRGTYWHLADSNGPAIINFSPTEWRRVSSKNRGAV